jgi:glucose/arabinose dehydrogenase
VRRLALLTVVAGLFAAAPAWATPTLQPVGTFSTPVGIAAPPGDPSRVMIVEKGGTIHMLRNGVKVAQPFADLTSITSDDASERGLLSVAFPPDYQSTGVFYVALTANAASATTGDGEFQIRELHRADADHTAPGGGRIVFSAAHASATNHNGGQLQFGPDGLLWFTIGDAANSANAQNTAVPYGKLNRIDPHPSAGRGYTIPADNPFGNSVWAYGLRNPWRFSFDRATGDLVIGDVGENRYEEIDYAPAPGLGRGADYGWPCREGLHSYSGSCAPGAVLTDPIVEQTHADGWSAIVGGYVVRDTGLPTLLGRYLYGDLSHEGLRILDVHTHADAATTLSASGLTSLGEDACGRLYTAVLGGTVSRVVDGTPSPCPATGGGGTPPPGGTPADTKPPGMSVRVRGNRHFRTHRFLTLRLRCSEPCRVTASGRVPGLGRFRTTHRKLAAGRRVSVRLWLRKTAAARVRRALHRHASVGARVRVSAVDAAGNAHRPVTRRVRLRR